MQQHFFIQYDFHGTPTQYIRWTNHQRVSDLFCDFKGLFQVAGHTRFRLGDSKFAHQLPKSVPILGQIDGFRRCSQNFDAGFSQLIGDVQRRLPAELNNYTLWFLLFINAQNILDGQGFKIEFIRGVVIRRDGFRVAVDHDGLIPFFPNGKGGMNTAIVKFNALPNPVGTTPKNHNFLAVAHRYLIRRIVGRIIISRVLYTTYRNRLPGFHHTQCSTFFSDIFFRNTKKFGEIFIRKSVFFGLDEEVIG